MMTKERNEGPPTAVALMRPALHLWWRYTWQMGVVPIALLLLVMFVAGVAMQVASGSHEMRLLLLLVALVAGVGLTLLREAMGSVTWITLSPVLALYGIWLFHARVLRDPFRGRSQALRFQMRFLASRDHPF